MRAASLIALASLVFATAGCVRRTITIESTPPGALAWLNDREIGRTPVQVDFLYYGDYDVRLVHEDAEPLMTHGVASPPLWDIPPLDLIAEVLPIPFHSRVRWYYELPPRDDDPAGLRERAAAFRGQNSENEPEG